MPVSAGARAPLWLWSADSSHEIESFAFKLQLVHTQHHPNASRRRLCTAGTMQSSNAFASLQLEGNSTIKAKLVVGSDGGNSKVRQMAQLRTVSWSYKQRGLVATVATATPNTSALQVFLPNGPLALLPVRDGFSNIVWSTTPAQAAELEAMTPTDFVNAVNMVGTADSFIAAASCASLLMM